MQIYRCYTHLASSCCFHLAENAAQIVRTFLHIGNSHQSKNMDEICQSGVTPPNENQGVYIFRSRLKTRALKVK